MNRIAHTPTGDSPTFHIAQVVFCSFLTRSYRRVGFLIQYTMVNLSILSPRKQAPFLLLSLCPGPTQYPASVFPRSSTADINSQYAGQCFFCRCPNVSRHKPTRVLHMLATEQRTFPKHGSMQRELHTVSTDGVERQDNGASYLILLRSRLTPESRVTPHFHAESQTFVFGSVHSGSKVCINTFLPASLALVSSLAISLLQSRSLHILQSSTAFLALSQRRETQRETTNTTDPQTYNNAIT